MRCKRISKKADKICTGDLNKKIILKSVAIGASDNVSYGRDFTNYKTLYAMVETSSRGVIIFDGSNTERVATHFFYIRYNSSVTAEYYVEYNSKNYDILTVENINEEDTFLLLTCTERGDKSISMNLV